MSKLFLILLALIMILGGCITHQKSTPDLAEDLCVAECKQAVNNNQNLTDGPCLSNQIIKDWVCDVAHLPRIEKDNFPENQCDAFRAGIAHHFVEVDAECNIIKIY